MASYVVLERRAVSGSRPETAFVRDEFSFLALLVPLVWLLWHRLWFAALMLLLVSVGIGLTGEYLLPGPVAGLAALAVNVFVALEGPAWRIARCRRNGFAEVGTVVARDLDDAEIRWFAGRGVAPAVPALRAADTHASVPPALPERQSDMLFGFAEEPAR